MPYPTNPQYVTARTTDRGAYVCVWSEGLVYVRLAAGTLDDKEELWVSEECPANGWHYRADSIIARWEFNTVHVFDCISPDLTHCLTKAIDETKPTGKYFTGGGFLFLPSLQKDKTWRLAAVTAKNSTIH